MSRVLSDERLARRAARGDERAFAAIFDRYHQRLYRYCLAIVGDAEDAQDALQNTMVKVLWALPGEERRIELKPWLYRIAHNESIELLRRRRETRRLDEEQAAPGGGLAEEAASRERLRRLLGDLEELPERQRGALVMRELAGLDFAEIGGALGTSPAAARQTLYEARRGLRQMSAGREMECEQVMRAISDGDGRVARRRDIRAHLRACATCCRFREEVAGRERDLAALSPLPAVAAAGLLQGLLGGHGAGGGGGGLAGALGGGAAKTVGASAALKGAAAVAVVAAIGVGAADRSGLIDGGSAGNGGSQATRVSQPTPPGNAGTGTGELGGVSASGAKAALSADRAGRGLASKAVVGAALGKGGSGDRQTNSAAGAAPASPGSLVHPHGRGHENQYPAASTHGQETAAAHKADGHSTAGSRGHPPHPTKPGHPPKSSHPTHPSNPATQKAPASPAANAGQGKSSTAAGAPQAASGTEASPDAAHGNKP